MPTLFASGELADAIQLVKQFGPFFLAVVFFLARLETRRSSFQPTRSVGGRTAGGDLAAGERLLDRHCQEYGSDGTNRKVSRSLGTLMRPPVNRNLNQRIRQCSIS